MSTWEESSFTTASPPIQRISKAWYESTFVFVMDTNHPVDVMASTMLAAIGGEARTVDDIAWSFDVGHRAWIDLLCFTSTGGSTAIVPLRTHDPTQAGQAMMNIWDRLTKGAERLGASLDLTTSSVPEDAKRMLDRLVAGSLVHVAPAATGASPDRAAAPVRKKGLFRRKG